MKYTLDELRGRFETRYAVEHYGNAALEVGLWDSERLWVEKYFKMEDPLLDIGCGAGRTTIGLFRAGYYRITGVDLSAGMINRAKQNALDTGFEVEFQQGNALALDFPSASFHNALFSFNGMMQIPGRADRVRAMREIRRVLRPGGRFIFTTHDMDNPLYLEKWSEEKKRWDAGTQDERLHEFGDLITNDGDNTELFIHVPYRSEIAECLAESGWNLLDDKLRSEISDEPQKVREFSADCRFWAAENA